MRTSGIIKGQRYGRLTAIADAGKTASLHPLWQFRCDCGALVVARTYRIRDGKTQSCGCLHSDQIKAANRRRVAIEPGNRFGRLVAIKEAGSTRKHILWLWLCDCGKTVTINASKVKSGHTKSCGCFSSDSSRARRYKHGCGGGKRTKEYRAWIGMRRRCYYAGSSSYPDYGARGITVCKRWRNSFENFLADMGLAPSPDHSVDRLKNSRGYSPGNCAWKTRIEQMNNRRGNVLITHDGKTLTLAAWARLTGIKRATLAARLRSGWTVHRALITDTKIVYPK